MDNEMIHYGVLGMKWGVRRTPAQLGHLTKKDNKWIKKKPRKLRRRPVRNLRKN